MRTLTISATLILCVILFNAGCGKSKSTPDQPKEEAEIVEKDEFQPKTQSELAKMSREEMKEYFRKQKEKTIAEVNEKIYGKPKEAEIKEAPSSFTMVNNSNLEEGFHHPGFYYEAAKKRFSGPEIEIESVVINETSERSSSLVSVGIINIRLSQDLYTVDGNRAGNWIVKKTQSMGQEFAFACDITTNETQRHSWRDPVEIKYSNSYKLGKSLDALIQENPVMLKSQEEHLMKIMRTRDEQTKAVTLRQKKLAKAREQRAEVLAKIAPIHQGVSESLSGNSLYGVFGNGDDFTGAINNFKINETEVDGKLFVPLQNIDTLVRGTIRVQQPHKSRGQLIPEHILLEMEKLEKGQWERWERFTYFPEQMAFISRDRKDTIIGYIPLSAEGQKALQGHLAQREEDSQSFANPWQADEVDKNDVVMVQTAGQGGYRYDLLNLKTQKITKGWWKHHEDPIPLKGKPGFYFLSDFGDYDDVFESWPFGIYDGEATVVQLLSANGRRQEHSPFGRNRGAYVISSSLQQAYRIIDGNIHLYQINWDEFALSEGIQVTQNSIFDNLELLGWFQNTVYFRNETKLGETLVTVNLNTRKVEENTMPFVFSHFGDLYYHNRGLNSKKLPGLPKEKLRANPSGSLILKSLNNGALLVRNMITGKEYRMPGPRDFVSWKTDKFINDYTLQGYGSDKTELSDVVGYKFENYPGYLDLLNKEISTLEGFGRVESVMEENSSGSRRYDDRGYLNKGLFWTLSATKAYRSRCLSQAFYGEGGEKDIYLDAVVMDRTSGKQYLVSVPYKPLVWIGGFRFVYRVEEGSFSQLGTWIYDCVNDSSERISPQVCKKEPYVSPDNHWLVFQKNNGEGSVVYDLKNKKSTDIELNPMGYKAISHFEVNLNAGRDGSSVWIGDRFIRPLSDEKLFEGKKVEGDYLTQFERVVADLQPENDYELRRIKAAYGAKSDDLETHHLGGLIRISNPSKYVEFILANTRFDGTNTSQFVDPNDSSRYTQLDVSVIEKTDKSLFLKLKDPGKIYRKWSEKNHYEMLIEDNVYPGQIEISKDFIGKAAVAFYCNHQDSDSRAAQKLVTLNSAEAWRNYPTKDQPVSWVTFDWQTRKFIAGPPLPVDRFENIPTIIENSLESAFRKSCDPMVFEDFEVSSIPEKISSPSSSVQPQPTTTTTTTTTTTRSESSKVEPSVSIVSKPSSKQPPQPMSKKVRPIDTSTPKVTETPKQPQSTPTVQAPEVDKPREPHVSQEVDPVATNNFPISRAEVEQALNNRLEASGETGVKLQSLKLIKAENNPSGPGFWVEYELQLSGTPTTREWSRIVAKINRPQKAWITTQRGKLMLLHRK